VRCGMCTAVGDFARVVYYMTQSADFGRELNLQDQVAASLDHTARALMLMTRFEEAWHTAQEGLKLAREIKNRDMESALLTTIAGLYVRNGDLAAALQAALQSEEIARRIGAMVGGIAGPWAVGTILRMQGEYEAAIANLQESVQHGFSLENFQRFMPAWPLASLGSTYAEIGPGYYPRAAEMHSYTLDLLTSPNGAPAAGTAFADIGFTALEQDRVDEAAEAFQKGLNFPSMYKYLYQPLLQVGAALVALRRNELVEATKLVDEARGYVEQRGMKNMYPVVASAEAQVLFASGEHERSLDEFARMEALATEMKMSPLIWQACAGEAKVLAALGRDQQAELEREGARQVIDDMAALFTDQEMRAEFVEGATRKLNAG
jgi:tetratricopeptide (TPR) repeat protein